MSQRNCIIVLEAMGNKHEVECSNIDPYADDGRGTFDMTIKHSLRSTFSIDPSKEVKQLKHDARVVLVRANKLLDI